MTPDASPPASKTGNILHQKNAGFEIIPNVFADSGLARIAQALDAAQVKRSRAGIRHLLTIPEILALAQEPRLIKGDWFDKLTMNG